MAYRKQVKIFQSWSADSLEREINSWLNNENPGFSRAAIDPQTFHYTIATNNAGSIYSCLVEHVKEVHDPEPAPNSFTFGAGYTGQHKKEGGA